MRGTSARSAPRPARRAASTRAITKVDGTRAYINIGSSTGVKVGDKFTIVHRGEELVDPVTGTKLGADEKQTGTGVVVEVSERFAIITVTGKAVVADVIEETVRNAARNPRRAT